MFVAVVKTVDSTTNDYEVECLRRNKPTKEFVSCNTPDLSWVNAEDIDSKLPIPKLDGRGKYVFDHGADLA